MSKFLVEYIRRAGGYLHFDKLHKICCLKVYVRDL